MPIRYAVPFLALILLGGCNTDSSVEHINAEQADMLNDIAANTSESDGNAMTTNGAAQDVGSTLRAGARAKPRPY